jgi:uncharacterized protein YycO
LLKLLFCTNDLPAAVAIRVFTWSDWSHVAIIDGDFLVEAVWPTVRVSSLSSAKRFYSRYCVADMPTKDDRAVIEAARSQIGKPYDVSALFGFLARREWQKTDKWFCSELVAWSFAQGGAPLFRPGTFSRVTPQHLWMITDRTSLNEERLG